MTKGMTPGKKHPCIWVLERDSSSLERGQRPRRSRDLCLVPCAQGRGNGCPVPKASCPRVVSGAVFTGPTQESAGFCLWLQKQVLTRSLV